MSAASTALTPGSASGSVTARLAQRGLIVLTLINLLNYLDRYIVTALFEDLKRARMVESDLGLGALVTGFLIVYMLSAPAFGAFGDRRSRTRLIAAGVFAWSLATFLSGLARNYLQLLAARALVGIGEAAYGTIAPSLLADYFPVRSRGRAFAIFGMAIPVGAALGYIVGGLIAPRLGWRYAFYVGGVPGMLLALWVLRLPDPPRGAQEEAQSAPAPAPTATSSPGTLATYARLLGQRPYRLSVLGYAAYTFAVGGLAAWMPAFLERVRAVPAGEARIGFGEIVVVTGFVGTLVGGWLGDYWLRHSRQAYLWMSGLVTLCAVPFAAVALSAHTPAVYYGATVLAELLLFMSTGPINAAIVNLVSAGERAAAVALSILTIHLLGDVISPSLIGAISDALRHFTAVSDAVSLGQAVLIVPVAMAVCGFVWLLAARASRLAEDTARVAAP
jgi:MFS family permease